MADILTTCCFCGCGCGLYLHVDEGRVTGVTPAKGHPVSKGNLCVKGWNIPEFIHDAGRLTEPLIRKDGRLVTASWDEALDLVASKFLEIREKYGGEALGLLGSARCSNEENYLLQKVGRAGFQTNNIDHCARL
jgi:predicted molibdopterin-dependent oxidoreductase YjgC